MAAKWKTALSLRMGLLVAIVAMPTLALSFYLTEDRRVTEAEHYRGETQRLARMVALQKAQNLRRIETQISSLTESRNFWDNSPCVPRLREIMRLEDSYHQLALVDSTGKVLCSAHPVEAGYHFDTALLNSAAARGGIVQTAGRISSDGHHWVIAFAEPLGRSGRPGEFLIAELEFGRAQTMLESLRLPENTVVSIVDSNAQIGRAHV
jgi:hypothetical protein